MKEGDLTTEQQAEMIAEASGWRRRALVAEAALKVSRAETEKAAQFAIAATPPMRDREAIAEKARELLCDACDYCGVTRPPGHLLMAPFDDQGEVWQVAMCAIERLLSLSPSPCDCLVREALKALMFEVRCNREPLSRPVHKALMRADAALQSPGGEE